MISENMKILRKKKRLSQEQAAEALGVTWRTYGSWERGEREPNIAALKQLSVFFDVSIDALVGELDIDDLRMRPSFIKFYQGFEAVPEELHEQAAAYLNYLIENWNKKKENSHIV